MDWSDLETLVRKHALSQPRGFQASLARRLGVTSVTISKQLNGSSRIPAERMPEYLDALGLELTVQPKEPKEPK